MGWNWNNLEAICCYVGTIRTLEEQLQHLESIHLESLELEEATKRHWISNWIRVSCILAAIFSCNLAAVRLRLVAAILAAIRTDWCFACCEYVASYR